MQITADCACVTKCFKKSGLIMENLHEEDNIDLENEMIVAELQLIYNVIARTFFQSTKI